MTSQAETVELLVKKANFQPHVALAVAEAIDNSIRDSQFVTVPILDARVAELKAMIEVTNERLSKEIDVKVGSSSKELEIKIGSVAKDLEIKMGSIAKDLEVKMGSIAKDLEVKMGSITKDLEVKIVGTKAELVRWVLLVMLASLAISLAADTVKHAIL